jgi:hypothetical protein
VRYASRSDGLLLLEASHTRVSQSCLKTSEGATTISLAAETFIFFAGWHAPVVSLGREIVAVIPTCFDLEPTAHSSQSFGLCAQAFIFDRESTRAVLVQGACSFTVAMSQELCVYFGHK